MSKMNLPNKLTLLRLCLVPVIMVLLLLPDSLVPWEIAYGVGVVIFAVTALKNLTHHFDWQAGWETNQVHCNGRIAAHSVNIAQRVGCGNLAEEVWIVNHWWEEVYGLHNTKIIAQFVNKSIVCGIKADNKIWIIEFWELSQNIGKDLRSDFGCSTSTFCHFSQAFAFCHL